MRGHNGKGYHKGIRKKKYIRNPPFTYICISFSFLKCIQGGQDNIAEAPLATYSRANAGMFTYSTVIDNNIDISIY